MNIIAAIKDSDTSVFQLVFTEYHEKLYFYILSKSKSEYLAEEVVQLTFIKFWNYRATLCEDLTVSTQLFRIATTTLIDLLRKQNSLQAVLKEVEHSNNNYSTNAALEKMSLAEVNKLLSEAMKNMPPVRKKIFEMSRFKGMSYNQIAAELSISPKTVESHISKAIKQVRHFFTILLFAFLPVFSFLFQCRLRVQAFLNVLY